MNVYNPNKIVPTDHYREKITKITIKRRWRRISPMDSKTLGGNQTWTNKAACLAVEIRRKII
jgi:hypothetical protein